MGIFKEEDASIEEKAIIDKYKAVLTGKTISVESLKAFCQSQIRIIEEKFASGDNSLDKDSYLKASLHVYLNLLKAIDAPEQEREALERHLTQLVS